MPTHYEVLGLTPGATSEQVRRAYLEAARRHHPDMHAGSEADVIAEARTVMATVNAAWEVLRDPDRRRAYDRSLGDAVPPPAPRAPAPPTAHSQDPEWIDEPSWRLEPDVDDTPPGWRAQSVVLVPVAFLAGAIGTFAFATMTVAPALMALSFVLLSLAGVGFVAAPLLTIRRRRPASPVPPRPRSEEH